MNAVMGLPCDPFNRLLLPSGLTREDRVALIAEACEAWIQGKQPSDAARLFTAGAVLSWLRDDGDLLRDYWRVRGPQGSTHTPAVLWKALREERQDGAAPRD